MGLSFPPLLIFDIFPSSNPFLSEADARGCSPLLPFPFPSSRSMTTPPLPALFLSLLPLTHHTCVSCQWRFCYLFNIDVGIYIYLVMCFWCYARLFTVYYNLGIFFYNFVIISICKKLFYSNGCHKNRSFGTRSMPKFEDVTVLFSLMDFQG